MQARQRSERRSRLPAFNVVIDLIGKDIEALPEKSVAVREKWREKRAVSVPATLAATIRSVTASVPARSPPRKRAGSVRPSLVSLNSYAASGLLPARERTRLRADRPYHVALEDTYIRLTG